MMAIAAGIGVSAGKRLLISTYQFYDITEKLSFGNDYGSSHYQITNTKSVIVAKKSANHAPSLPTSNRQSQSIKSVNEHIDTEPAIPEPWLQRNNCNELEVENSDLGYSVEDLLLLQKSMLEKQWNLSFEGDVLIEHPRKQKTLKTVSVTSSGVSARQRRINAKTKSISNTGCSVMQSCPVLQRKSVIDPQLLQNRSKGYVKGVVSEELLSHAEVVYLSEKLQVGLRVEEHRARLKEKLGYRPSDAQLAMSLRISRIELQKRLIECSLASKKLTLSNVRLVMSIAQRYDNMGAEMADLVQGGLIGLLRGIEKFDSSKGFKLSTYVYWWIRQGVSRALAENSGTLRLPVHMHERVASIRRAKSRLKARGITPTVDSIAKCLNMSQRKVRNGIKAMKYEISLDREAFRSLDGLPGETLHSYIADDRIENSPWYEVRQWELKREVNKLLNETLGERERLIIRLYYGLDGENLTWEEIGKRIGLSRERVRQIGRVSFEKIRVAARGRGLESLLVTNYYD